MPVISLPFRFRQPFRAPAQWAFEWCIDFRPEDASLYPNPKKRTVQRLADGALVLTDTTYPKGRPLRIRRLIRIDRASRSWTNTHIDGPFRHSQFWYRVVPDGARSSHLEFRGLQLLPSRRSLSKTEIAKAAEELRREDALLWRRHLAPALDREAAQRR